MASARLELILEAQPAADRAALNRYLREQGFDPLPMKVGVLLSDDLGRLRTLLPALSGTEQDDLQVPEPLKAMVRTIRISKPRSFHGP